MKNLLLITLLAIIFASCKRDDPINPPDPPDPIDTIGLEGTNLFIKLEFVNELKSTKSEALPLPDSLKITTWYDNAATWEIVTSDIFEEEIPGFTNPVTVPVVNDSVNLKAPKAISRFLMIGRHDKENSHFILKEYDLTESNDNVEIIIQSEEIQQTISILNLDLSLLAVSGYDFTMNFSYDLQNIDYELATGSGEVNLFTFEESKHFREQKIVITNGDVYLNDNLVENIQLIEMSKHYAKAALGGVNLDYEIFSYGALSGNLPDTSMTTDPLIAKSITRNWLEFESEHYIEFNVDDPLTKLVITDNNSGATTSPYQLTDSLIVVNDDEVTLYDVSGYTDTTYTVKEFDPPFQSDKGALSLWMTIEKESSELRSSIEFDGLCNISIKAEEAAIATRDIVSTDGLVAGEKHHFIITWNNENVEIYVNGKLIASKIESLYQSEGTPIWFRLRSNDENNSTSIEKIHLWKRNLYASEVETLYNSGDGLTSDQF